MNRTLFVVWATDKPGMLAVRQEVRPAHRARLREPGVHPVRVLLAGPTLDEGHEGGMNGTMLVVEADDIDAVRAFVDQDPYSLRGVYASVEVRPWQCGLGPLVSSSQ